MKELIASDFVENRIYITLQLPIYILEFSFKWFHFIIETYFHKIERNRVLDKKLTLKIDTKNGMC